MLLIVKSFQKKQTLTVEKKERPTVNHPVIKDSRVRVFTCISLDMLRLATLLWPRMKMAIYKADPEAKYLMEVLSGWVQMIDRASKTQDSVLGSCILYAQFEKRRRRTVSLRS